MRNIFARAVITDTIPREFAVYDLPEFLSCLSLLGSPDLEFDDKLVRIIEGTNVIKYLYSNASVVIAPPDKEMRMPAADIKFTLSEAQLLQIQKSSAVMKLKELAITKNGITVLNTDANGNRIDIALPVDTELDNPNVVIKVDDIKVIPADYDVNVSCSGTINMIQFVSKTAGVQLEYFIAIQA
jgi:hypothetical protein